MHIMWVIVDIECGICYSQSRDQRKLHPAKTLSQFHNNGMIPKFNVQYHNIIALKSAPRPINFSLRSGGNKNRLLGIVQE